MKQKTQLLRQVRGESARNQRLIVDLVHDRFAIEGDQRVARAQAMAVCRRSALHRFNHMPHAFSPLL